MLGAIIGDIIGSSYEFNNVRDKEVPLFTSLSYPTDDSIMTLAVADVLQKGYQYDPKMIVETFKMWAKAYPDSGYGVKFSNWGFSSDTEPYYSMGNGAAMRVSPVGWYARSEEEVKELAKCVTEVTHNHPDGLKAAEVVAMCVYYARRGKSKKFIKEYVERYYDLDFDYEDLKINNVFDDTCEGSVPQAIYCFLISKSYVDCIKNCISIGGDCDTTSAIAGSIAEAYYKFIPGNVKEEALACLRDEEPSPFDVINTFLDDFMDDYILSEEKTSKTVFLKVTEGSNEFVGHCKKIAPLKEYIIIRLEEACFNRMNYIKKILGKVVDYDGLKMVVEEINELSLDFDISFMVYKRSK